MLIKAKKIFQLNKHNVNVFIYCKGYAVMRVKIFGRRKTYGATMILQETYTRIKKGH
jgi:hypothetical protein